MGKFPVDVSKSKALKTLGLLGFHIVREREHISMIRENPDGTRTPLTIPNHPFLKVSTLRTVCSQCRIAREEFLRAYERA